MLQNLAIINIQTELNNKLQFLSNVLYNSSVYLYQNIAQNTYTNLQYDIAKVNYDYLPTYYQYVQFISFSQIGDVIQNYTNQANSIITFINQTGLANVLQSKINSITQSISTLNNFAVNLYNNQQSSLYIYVVPTRMSIRTAMFKNNIDFSQLDLILLYNLGVIQTVQILPQGFNLTLIRS
jgi:hypothetical protein